MNACVGHVCRMCGHPQNTQVYTNQSEVVKVCIDRMPSISDMQRYTNDTETALKVCVRSVPVNNADRFASSGDAAGDASQFEEIVDFPELNAVAGSCPGSLDLFSSLKTSWSFGKHEDTRGNCLRRSQNVRCPKTIIGSQLQQYGPSVFLGPPRDDPSVVLGPARDGPSVVLGPPGECEPSSHPGPKGVTVAGSTVGPSTETDHGDRLLARFYPCFY